MNRHVDFGSDASSLRRPTASECRTARIWAGTFLALLGTTIGACTSLGSRQLPVDRFDYNSAIASSSNEQMLINLVRLRFGEVPTFLAVNSVITQYVWTGEIGAVGASGENLGFPAWTVGGSANLRYLERPTVTYAPLSGQEFASQLISPVRSDVIFSLVSSGWPPDELLTMTLQRVNDVQNLRFGAPGETSDDRHAAFARVIGLIIELAKHDAIELVRSAKTESEALYLELAESPDPPTRALIDELKSAVGLDPALSRFRVTRKIVGREPDEVTIRMHSLLELMGLLSAGIEVPGPQGAPPSAPERFDGDHPMPFHIRCCAERPTDALAAVQYNGNWFYLARSDESSKRAFGLLIYLFQMQASQNPGVGPILTVPVG